MPLSTPPPLRGTRRSGWALLALGLAVGLPVALPPVAAAQPSEVVTAIVRLQSGGDVDAQAIRASEAGGQPGYRYRSALRGFSVRIPARALPTLRRLPQVVSVELDTPVYASETTSVWGLDRIDQRRLPLSGTYSYADAGAGAGVSAYVLDTGIMGTHQDFGNRVRAGYSAIDDGRGTSDCHGHGTHVAGTVAGTTYGVAKQAELVAVRVLGCDGSGTTSQVIAGLDWVAAQHAAGTPAVANLSLGGEANSSMDAAVQALVADGVTVSLAAGNENTDACNRSPARVREALTVGASTRTDARAAYSNYGGCVDLFAPGDQIPSAGTSGTTAVSTRSGTSMAAPHVAGVAALLLAGRRDLSPAAVASAMLGGAVGDVVTGAGTGSPNRLLQVGAAAAVAAPVISGPGDQSGTVGTVVSLALSATGGTTPYAWTATGLPSGLSIDRGTGRISGTPGAAANASATVTVTDGAARTAAATFAWTIRAAAAAPGCAGAGQRLVNPGFESGAQGWLASSGVIGQTGARTGGWAARLGGTGRSGSTTLEQTVVVPAGCPSYRLSFWMRIDSAETSRSRIDSVQVTLGSSRLATYSNVDRGSGWVQRTFDVSQYAGRTVKLALRATEDRGEPTTFGVDDLALTTELISGA